MSGKWVRVVVQHLPAMTTGICLLAVALCMRGFVADRAWKLHRISLTSFFLMMLVEVAAQLNLGTSAADDLKSGAGLTLLPAVGAIAWFYAKGLVEDHPALNRRDLWHLVPIAIIYASLLPILTLSTETRQGIFAEQPDLADPVVLAAIFTMLIGWITWIGLLVGYGFATLRLLTRSYQLTRQLYSNLDGKSLIWLQTLIVLVFCFIVLTIGGSLLPATPYDYAATEAALPAFQFGVALAVAVFGLNQDSVVPDWNELNEPAVSDEPKYERSGLTPADMVRIAGKLHLQMADNRLWQNPDLSLKDLSEATGVAQNSISQTLNAHIGANFFDYVNQWRIQAACQALLTTDMAVLTIAEDTGFNAKSTFNSAFKKVTGQTPRQFRLSADPDAIPTVK